MLAADYRPRNRLLASLPAEELDRLRPDLVLESLELRQVLFDVDKTITNVYFPEDSLVSIMGVMSDGTAIETATIAYEGIVGLPVFLGTDQMSAQAFVQVPGDALKLSAERFRSAVLESPSLVAILNRYTQALFMLVAQSSACNRVHSMVQRCARWMLHTHDRVAKKEFPLTHQFISQMLGVRRATVTEAMGKLQESGSLRYEMGRVEITNRAQLEREACECYVTITREFDRLLDTRWSPRGAKARRREITEEHGISVLGDGVPASRELDAPSPG